MLSVDASHANGVVTIEGATLQAANRFGYLGQYFIKIQPGATGRVTFAHHLYRPGAYRVQILYPAADTIEKGDEGRTTNAAVTIGHAAGVTSFTINQTYPLLAGSGGIWEELGIYTFRTGQPSPDYVSFDNAKGDGWLTISAVKLIPLDPLS